MFFIPALALFATLTTASVAAPIVPPLAFAGAAAASTASAAASEVVAPKSGAGEAKLLSDAAKVSYLLRIAEKCQLDAANLDAAAEALGDEIADRADVVQADRLALSNTVTEAAKRADAEYAGTPPDEVCKARIAELEQRIAEH